MDINETEAHTTGDPPTDHDPAPDAYCVAHHFGQLDTYAWVKLHRGDLLALAPVVFAAFDALAASEPLKRPVPDTLRAIFVRHVDAGELLTGDEGCWRAGVAAGITNIVADRLDHIVQGAAGIADLAGPYRI
jgi:hypothetical protein